MNNQAKLIKIREAIRFNSRMMSESGDGFLNQLLGSYNGLHIIAPERIVLKFFNRRELLAKKMLFRINDNKICRMAIPFDNPKIELTKIISECNNDLMRLTRKFKL